MGFEIKYSTEAGLFNIKLERDVSSDEAIQLAQIGFNVLGMGVEIKKSAPSFKMMAPVAMSSYGSNVGATIISSGKPRQTKLGEFPVDTIPMGYYQEPREGVRIKMVALPPGGKRVDAVRLMMAKTAISMKGCNDVLLGNHKCPILNAEIAEEIMKSFRSWDIFAVIEQAGLVGVGGREHTSGLDKREPNDYDKGCEVDTRTTGGD